MKEDLQKVWDAAAGDIPEETSPQELGTALTRFMVTLPAFRAGLAMPTTGTCEEPSLNAAMSLCFEVGLRGRALQGPNMAVAREALVDGFIKAGDCSRLLFLDPNVVIDGTGFWELMVAMDKTKAAVTAALVRTQSEHYNAVLGEGADQSFVTEADIPVSGTPFPVTGIGLGAALLDLTQIASKPGPRFGLRTEGYEAVDEETVFNKWLQHHELQAFAVPSVRNIRYASLGYRHPRVDPQQNAPGKSSIVVPEMAV